MDAFSQWVYSALVAFQRLIGAAGLPLAVAAWLGLLIGAVVMGRRLSRHDTAPHRRVAGIIAAIALAAHLGDFALTLRLTPELVDETNPLWRAVIDHVGYQMALLYGLTGKLLIALLSYQLYVGYRIHRVALFPAHPPASFIGFVRVFGATHIANLANFLSFCLPLLSPAMFYVMLLSVVESDWLQRLLPPFPVVLLAWVMLLPLAYFWVSQRAALRGEAA